MLRGFIPGGIGCWKEKTPARWLCASYQAYGLWAKCRPDKAFTPHPAVVRHA
ncbi:hypothetical protein [Escherichia coli]|uniref:hypothetical protein n=1 Tax=Escherichia coli TaxID=562 RepID=UPI001C7CD5C2|nr:hypothetical protein [Escherichia coli]QZA49687.1 hypothetical protein K3830_21720 [Escherichia coli]